MRRPGIIERRAPGSNVRVPEIGGGGGGGGDPPDPNLIAGAVLWFDMSDPTAYTELAGALLTVTNKISLVVWAEATNRPAFSATGLGGASPAAVFDGTNDRFIDTLDSTVITTFTNGGSRTIYVVGATTVADANRAMFGFGDSAAAAASSGDFGISASGNGRLVLRSADTGGTAHNAEATATSYDTAPHIYIGWHDGVGHTGSGSVDDATANPDAAAQDEGTVAPNRVCWGCIGRSTPTFFWSGAQSEVRIYNSLHDATKRTAIHDLLATKWGL